MRTKLLYRILLAGGCCISLSAAAQEGGKTIYAPIVMNAPLPTPPYPPQHPATPTPSATATWLPTPPHPPERPKTPTPTP
jgi:hypothetical protein